MDEADVLEEAAGLLEAEGWVRGSLYNDPALHDDENSGYCALGAIKEVVGTLGGKLVTDSQIKLERITADTLEMYVMKKYPGSNIPDWNDDPGRTSFEVIDTLKTVAKELRNNTTKQE